MRGNYQGKINIKNRLKIKILFTVILSFLFLISSNNLYAQKPEKGPVESKPSILNFLKDIFKKFEFTSRVSQEYESNIFLTEDNEDSDIKTTVYQGFSLRLPKDSIYFQLDYGANLDYYHQEAEHVYVQDVNTILSYRPFDKISFGISDNFTKVSKSKIATALGDKLITLGYNQNRTNFQAKYDLDDNTSMNFAYGLYRLDVSDQDRDDFIDRLDSDINFMLEHQFSPNLGSFIGYGYQKVRFRQTSVKNSQSTRCSIGLIKKFPEYFKLTSELGYEHKDIDTQRHDDNVDFKILANPLFSTYTKLFLSLEFNRLVPSSRSEFSQYARRSFIAQLQHFLTPKLILITNLNYERQKFDQADSITSSIDDNRYTDIYSCGATFKRVLNDWLSVDAGYTFTKRDAEFASEGYTDHEVILGLTANY
ncbi:MAG: outer membrane beta-barrel protein [Candidatus Omnitrophica bacterium]|nr:outer membrane beta-barrel protein [Candidatus Omnitrophota bacterium]